jgi:hypothetical protein
VVTEDHEPSTPAPDVPFDPSVTIPSEIKIQETLGDALKSMESAGPVYLSFGNGLKNLSSNSFATQVMEFFVLVLFGA